MLQSLDFISHILTNFDQKPQDCRAIDLTEKNLSKVFFQSQILASRVPVLLKQGVPIQDEDEMGPRKSQEIP